MTDLMKIAMDRRAELHAEAARIDAFIRMAEELLRTAGGGAVADGPGRELQPGAAAALAGPGEVAPGTAGEGPIRRGPALVVG